MQTPQGGNSHGSVPILHAPSSAANRVGPIRPPSSQDGSTVIEDETFEALHIRHLQVMAKEVMAAAGGIDAFKQVC